MSQLHNGAFITTTCARQCVANKGGFLRLIDESAVGVYKSKVFYDSALLSQQASIMASATPTTSVRGTSI